MYWNESLDTHLSSVELSAPHAITATIVEPLTRRDRGGAVYYYCMLTARPLRRYDVDGVVKARYGSRACLAVVVFARRRGGRFARCGVVLLAPEI